MQPRYYKVSLLFLKLSVWVVPTFAIGALLGLHLLSQHVVAKAEQTLSMRVGNLAGRVASGIERMGETLYDDPEMALEAGQEIIQTLMSDPAMRCAVMKDPSSGVELMLAPARLGCHPGIVGQKTVLPLWFDGDMDLEVTWGDEEIQAVRMQQRELSLFILLFGLCIALLTNWMAFRVIIGKPLQMLINRIEDARDKAEFAAFHDGLTGLANRRALDDAIAEAGDWSREYQQPLTIMSLDLDGFKDVNDTLGHPAGDHVLREVARILETAIEPTDRAYRIGGDEFVCILGPDRSRDEACRLASELIKRVSDPIDFGSDTCTIGTSVGIATAASLRLHSQDAERLLMNADIALYQAKANGKRCYSEFDHSMRTEVEERRALSDDMARMFANGELVVFYQPQYESTGRFIEGVEALVRWNHPDRGILPPIKFLDIAEDLGLTSAIDKWVFHRALDDMLRWEDLGLSGFSISVNVSTKRLSDPALDQDLKSRDIPRGRLIFEVLESVLVEKEDQQLAWNVDLLKDMGIQIEIDDFGTGHASMTSVLSLKPARIKIAREIINAFAEEGAQDELLQAVSALGEALGVGLVAEGVETLDHVEHLGDLKFERLQGYGLCRPKPFDEVTARLRNELKPEQKLRTITEAVRR